MLKPFVLLAILSLVFGESLNDKTDIITIATGGYEAHKLVSSLHHRGKWKSPPYVVSDNCTFPLKNTFNIHVPKTKTTSTK